MGWVGLGWIFWVGLDWVGLDHRQHTIYSLFGKRSMGCIAMLPMPVENLSPMRVYWVQLVCTFRRSKCFLSLVRSHGRPEKTKFSQNFINQASSGPNAKLHFECVPCHRGHFCVSGPFFVILGSFECKSFREYGVIICRKANDVFMENFLFKVFISPAHADFR